MHLACYLFRLTPDEALRGFTVNSAKALGLADKAGLIAVGRAADLAVWDTTIRAASPTRSAEQGASAW